MFKTSYFTQPIRPATISALARQFEAEVEIENAGTDQDITATARVFDLDAQTIGYFDGAKPLENAPHAGVIITHKAVADSFSAQTKIICSEPRKLFIQITNALLETNPIDYAKTLGIAVDLAVPDSADIADGATVMQGARIGENCRIETGAVIFPGVVLGDRVHVKSGALIGTSGAAIHVSDEMTLSQPHVGTVVVGDGVEIGSLSNVVRGIFGATTIGNRVVIGNLANVGHNVAIGHGTWIGASTVVAGYTTVGNFTNIGIGALCKNGIKIGDKCNIAMGSCLSKHMPDGASCFGNPAKVTGFNIAAGPAKPFPL